MGQVTSGVGLISGLPIDQIVSDLLSIEARPRTLVQNRNTVLQSQQTAFQEINAQLLSLKNASASFVRDRVFRGTTVTSSNPEVLTATSQAGAAQGNFTLRVSRLVSAQQLITRGFTDTDATGVGAGTLTFERSEARLDSDTTLASLNGGRGVARGTIRITDGSGNTQSVDLSTAVTVGDVLERISAADGLNIRAEASGDSLRLTDTLGAGAVTVTGVSGATTAADLGLAGVANTGDLVGNRINFLGDESLLASAGDGAGVRVRQGVADLRLATASGSSFDVNLDGALTFGDVIDRINTATSGAVEASINADGTGLNLADLSDPGNPGLTVTALNGSGAAADLGLLGGESSPGVVTGAPLIAELNSKLVSRLNGGAGIAQGSLEITNAAGTLTSIDLSGARSISGVLRAINGSGAGVTAAINTAGNGLTLTDTSGGAGDLVIADDGSGLADDLGLAGTFADGVAQAGNLQYRYVTEATRLDALGVERGRFEITDSAGRTATVDLTQGDEITVDDVLREINSRGLALSARINDQGDGIVLEDTNTGAAGVAISVRELGGRTAASLGLSGSADAAGQDLVGSFEKTVSFTNETLTGATPLSALNGGEGVRIDSDDPDFTVTDRAGRQFDVDLAGATTIDDVIGAINAAASAAGSSFAAAINATSTGLNFTDTGGGSARLTIAAANNSRALADLGIAPGAGSDTDDDGVLRGGQLVETTTLRDLADLINEADVGVGATIINDGSAGAPFRLSLTAREGGTDSAFVFDDGGLGFNTSTLSEARDAVVFVGGGDPASSLLVTSKSNQLTEVVPGVTIDLKGVSSSPVNVSVAADNASIVESVRAFVDGFNAVADVLDKHDSFDAETEERGLLLGDSTVAQVRQRLFSVVTAPNNDARGRFKALFDVGIRVGEGARLTFDETRFNEALASDPGSVRDLFTFQNVVTDPDTGDRTVTARGVGQEIDQLLSRLTDPVDGVVRTAVDNLQTQVDLNNGRIETLTQQLAAKRARLEAQFLAMERTLALLQQQSQSLASFAPLSFQPQQQQR